MAVSRGVIFFLGRAPSAPAAPSRIDRLFAEGPAVAGHLDGGDQGEEVPVARWK